MAKTANTVLCVALIDLPHLKAPAGALVQGPLPAVAALLSVGAVDDSKEAVAYAKAQKAPQVAMAEKPVAAEPAAAEAAQAAAAEPAAPEAAA